MESKGFSNNFLLSELLYCTPLFLLVTVTPCCAASIVGAQFVVSRNLEPLAGWNSLSDIEDVRMSAMEYTDAFHGEQL